MSVTHVEISPTRLRDPITRPQVRFGVVVLTTDTALADALRSALAEQYSVTSASTLEEAEELAIAGRCSILVTDQLGGQTALRHIGQRLRAHEPALVLIAVGGRGDENALASLLSAGVADRLMLKPVTPALALIVAKSAAQQHRALKASATEQTRVAEAAQPAAAAQESSQAVPAEVATPQTDAAPQSAPLPRPPWLVVAGALIAVAAIVWWVASQRVPDIDPRAVIKTNLEAAQRALQAGRAVSPAGRSAVDYYGTVLALDPSNAQAKQGLNALAARFVRNAQTSIAAGEMASAIVALDGLRRVRPDDPQLTRLEAQLRDQQDNYVRSFQASRDALAKEAAARAAARPPQPTPAAAPKPAPATDPERAPPPVRLASVLSTQPELTPIEVRTSEPTLSEEIDTPASAAVKPHRGITKLVQPDYPMAALLSATEGWVDVSLSVTAAGDVLDPRVRDSSNSRLFERAALNAVRKWKYEPRPGVESEQTTVRVQFRLKELH